MTATLLALIVGTAFLIWGCFVAWQWRGTVSLADEAFAAGLEDRELSPGIDQNAFKKAFIRAEGPRLGTYVLVSAILAAAALPFAVFVFANIWQEIWNLMGQIDWAERGGLVYVAIMIFVYSGLFFVIAWFAMMRYHQKRPASLRSEIRRLNESAQDKDAGK